MLLDRSQQTQLRETLVAGDIVGVCVTADTGDSVGRVTFYKNGKQFASATVASRALNSSECRPFVGLSMNAKLRVNFGSLRPFAFEPVAVLAENTFAHESVAAVSSGVGDGIQRTDPLASAAATPPAPPSPAAVDALPALLGGAGMEVSRDEEKQPPAALCSDEEVLQFARHFSAATDTEKCGSSSPPSAMASPLLGPRFVTQSNNLFPSAMIEIEGQLRSIIQLLTDVCQELFHFVLLVLAVKERIVGFPPNVSLAVTQA